MVNASVINHELVKIGGLSDERRAKLTIGTATHAEPAGPSPAEKQAAEYRRKVEYKESCRRAWAGGGG